MKMFLMRFLMTVRRLIEQKHIDLFNRNLNSPGTPCCASTFTSAPFPPFSTPFVPCPA
jgi:hypothetical protein